MSNLRSQEQHESSIHGLRFEAYELPKPLMPSKVTPVSHAPSTDLVSVSESLYSRETPQISSVASSSEAGSSELKLRLDGVQRKWGRTTQSSPSPATSSSTSQNPVDGVTQVDTASAVNSKVHDSYDSRKPQVEISPEKQKLAASLFGGSTKPEKRPSASRKVPKGGASAADKSQQTKAVVVSNEVAVEKTNRDPPPDLLDLGEPTITSAPPAVDPFKQLEGLLDPSLSSTTNHSAGASTKALDIMALYGEATTSGQSGSGGYSFPVSGDSVNLLSELSNATLSAAPEETMIAPSSQSVKGPNHKDALEKDALVRQMGVTPLSQNPNLFKDLLG